MPKIEDSLVQLSCLGRAAGYYTIICTQRADHEAISSQIKANVLNNYSFAQRDTINARVAGVIGAEKLTRPGIGILAHGLTSNLVYVPLLKSEEVVWGLKNIASQIGFFGPSGSKKGGGV